MNNDEYVLTLADLADAGFCLGRASEYMTNIGVTMDDVEAGRVTLGWLRTVQDGHCQRLVRVIEGRLSLPAREDALVVRPGDLFRYGWSRADLRERCNEAGISWDDVRHGKVTTAFLRESDNSVARQLAEHIENNMTMGADRGRK